MRLIGDIGGTNARFALADKQGNISEVKNFLKKDYAAVKDALLAYKTSVAVEITEIVLAVNTPVVEGWPHVNTNNWGYENKNLVEELNVKRIVFFNDLQAHAMSLPFLKAEDKIQIYGGAANPKGTIAVAGPGTGLGLAYGVYDQTHKKHIFHASEGGNQIASGIDEEQLEIIKKVLKVRPFVRWEDLSSGRGIIALYSALFAEEKPVEEIMDELANGCEKARVVFKLFCEFLGGFVHNVGTTFLPEGGIYIIGGILTRKENIEFLLNQTKFADYYYSPEIYKAHGAYLKNYPIYLVTHFNPALLGLANYN